MLTSEDLRVALTFLARAPSRNRHEAHSLVVVCQRIEAAVKQMETPPAPPVPAVESE